jgi:hypothetical protein
MVSSHNQRVAGTLQLVIQRTAHCNGGKKNQKRGILFLDISKAVCDTPHHSERIVRPTAAAPRRDLQCCKGGRIGLFASIFDAVARW